MTQVQKKRLLWISLITLISAIIIALVLFALSQNINLFYSPSEIAAGNAPKQHRIRVGGMVEKGSIQRDPHGLGVRFILTDFQHQLTVHYTGILPDLFREGQGIVAQGVLGDNQQFQASEVLAKHDENYMPPEVAQALAKVKNNGNP